MRTAPPPTRRAAVAATVGLVIALLAGCGSSGSDGASTTTEAPAATTAAPTTETTIPVTTTAAPTTTTSAVPSDLTPEETAVAFVRALVEGHSAAAFVRDDVVANDAERQLGEMGQAAYDSVALDPARSQETSGAPDTCAVNDATVSCYVLIDRSSSDSEGVDTLVRVDVATHDLSTVSGPDDLGPTVPAYVVGIEIVPA